MAWKEICPLADIPKLGSRVVRTSTKEIGVFRTETDGVFAINNLCPQAVCLVKQCNAHCIIGASAWLAVKQKSLMKVKRPVIQLKLKMALCF